MAPQMNPTFANGTTPQDAQALTMAALGVIGGGWPAVYFRQPVIEGGQVMLDLDAMTRDAVALAVQVQAASLRALHAEEAEWSH